MRFRWLGGLIGGRWRWMGGWRGIKNSEFRIPNSELRKYLFILNSVFGIRNSLKGRYGTNVGRRRHAYPFRQSRRKPPHAGGRVRREDLFARERDFRERRGGERGAGAQAARAHAAAHRAGISAEKVGR